MRACGTLLRRLLCRSPGTRVMLENLQSLDPPALNPGPPPLMLIRLDLRGTPQIDRPLRLGCTNKPHVVDGDRRPRLTRLIAERRNLHARVLADHAADDGAAVMLAGHDVAWIDDVSSVHPQQVS